MMRNILGIVKSLSRKSTLNLCPIKCRTCKTLLRAEFVQTYLMKMFSDFFFQKFFLNGSQLAKMKKSIPDMSLPKNL